MRDRTRLAILGERLTETSSSLGRAEGCVCVCVCVCVCMAEKENYFVIMTLHCVSYPTFGGLALLLLESFSEEALAVMSSTCPCGGRGDRT